MDPAAPRATPAAALLSPGTIAIVGASDRSRWSRTIFDNLSHLGFRGRVVLVNPKNPVVHDRPAVASCAEAGGIDQGVVLVPGAAVPQVTEELADAGARSAMILSSGFAETGPEGAALQERVRATAARRGVTLLGPNSLGYINHAGATVAWATPVELVPCTSGTAIISQSGATALFLTQFAHQQNIELSHVVATGNEADLDLTALLEHLVEAPEARAVALFIESVRDPARFRACAARALELGKPLVVLKVGRSEVGARSAAAHTGSLVGDDRVFDGICRRYGVMRVDSIEDLVITADIAARVGPLRAGGLAVLSNSGGICEIAADRAAELGLALPELSEQTREGIAALLPGYGTPHNPLDLTGGIDPAGCESIVRLLGAQPDVAAVLCPYYPVPAGPEEQSERLDALHAGLGAGLNGIEVPGLLVSYTGTGVTPFARDRAAVSGLPYHACGLDRALRALAALRQWSDRLRTAVPEPAPEPAAAPGGPRPRSEAEALAFLRRHGAPVMPFRLAASADEAAEAVQDLAGDGPAVLKIASPDILHKSDIGGVRLNLRGAAEVRSAHDEILGNARRTCPDARIDGVLVAPMRGRGVELLVGIRRDPQWGPVLALGLGGIFVEILEDVALRPLPVDPDEVLRLLDELKGAALLDGARGVPAADRHALARAVVAICGAALAAGPALEVLEVNPLWVRGSEVEALDALMEWKSGEDAT